jgi:hypothetical protein
MLSQAVRSLNTSRHIYFSATGAMLLAATTFTPQAFAASDSKCHNYANIATALSAANSQLGCGFNGSRWSQSYNQHFKFCKKSEGNLRNETRMRNKQIAQCASGIPDQILGLDFLFSNDFDFLFPEGGDDLKEIFPEDEKQFDETDFTNTKYL